jgi:hypothetical protein
MAEITPEAIHTLLAKTNAKLERLEMYLGAWDVRLSTIESSLFAPASVDTGWPTNYSGDAAADHATSAAYEASIMRLCSRFSVSDESEVQYTEAEDQDRHEMSYDCYTASVYSSRPLSRMLGETWPAPAVPDRNPDRAVSAELALDALITGTAAELASEGSTYSMPTTPSSSVQDSCLDSQLSANTARSSISELTSKSSFHDRYESFKQSLPAISLLLKRSFSIRHAHGDRDKNAATDVDEPIQVVIDYIVPVTNLESPKIARRGRTEIFIQTAEQTTNACIHVAAKATDACINVVGKTTDVYLSVLPVFKALFTKRAFFVPR